MPRTESMTIQVHPNDEQSQINLMQHFHWSLLSTQEIKTIDSHLERRGDKIYQITNSANYIKLAFSRELNLPNLDEVRRLEKEYFSLPTPVYPGMTLGVVLAVLILVIFGAATRNFGIGLILAIGAFVAFYIYGYTPKKKSADEAASQTESTRRRILRDLEQYG
ncbi:MAG TPA: hypothetical protein VGC87_04750 [Pyrinomonadaceae bacterium]